VEAGATHIDESRRESRTGEIGPPEYDGQEEERHRKVNGINISNGNNPKKRKLVLSNRPGGTAKKGEEEVRGALTTSPAPKRKKTTSMTSLQLLTLPEDEAVLSPLHAFVRRQIEIFVAGPEDLAEPAPGRKNSIRLNQVGLRCIHCRHLPCRERVKRAVFYPSSVRRVYSSVSDFKLDHLKTCPCVTPDVRAELIRLKEDGRKSDIHSKKTKTSRGNKSQNNKKAAAKLLGCSSSTAQYYHDAARKIGMVDGDAGVFMSDAATACTSFSRTCPPRKKAAPPILSAAGSKTTKPEEVRQVTPAFLPVQSLEHPVLTPRLLPLAMKDTSGLRHQQYHELKPAHPPPVLELAPPAGSRAVRGRAVLLSSPSDGQHLNALHCFVRRRIEVFEADEGDVSQPSPGRKTRISVGQVGVRCVYCSGLPPKHRVKRSACYPPSIHGIYHAVSNIKFDHFPNCAGMPPGVRDAYLALRSSAGRKPVAGISSSSSLSSSSSKAKTGANSTAQYYYESAMRLGLVDTEKGIRFGTAVRVGAAHESSRVRVAAPLARPSAVPPNICSSISSSSSCRELAAADEKKSEDERRRNEDEAASAGITGLLMIASSAVSSATASEAAV